jgi:hypothetical protein
MRKGDSGENDIEAQPRRQAEIIFRSKIEFNLKIEIKNTKKSI